MTLCRPVVRRVRVSTLMVAAVLRALSVATVRNAQGSAGDRRGGKLRDDATGLRSLGTTGRAGTRHDVVVAGTLRLTRPHAARS